MTPHFFWKSLLVVALEQPFTVPTPNGSLWISSKEHLRVQSQPGSVSILPVKKGLVFLSGIKNSEAKPQAVAITTLSNFEALKKCKDYKKVNFENGNLVYSGASIDPILSECGFDDLSFASKKSNAPSQELQNLFRKNEKNLRINGISLGIAEWNSGKRHLVVHSSMNEKHILERISEPLRPFYQLEQRAQFSPGKNLIFELTLFEFSRQRARSLGLKWPTSVSLISVDPMGNGKQLLQSTANGNAQNILLEADFGESQGVGRVLAQPTLRTQPGIESRFLSGGEFPVKNSNAFQSQTNWKSYGLKIAITPNAQSKAGDTEVSLDFKLEFSEPNMDNVVEGIPSLVQRQLESRFDVRTNETTVLTTMVTLREGRGRAGVAFLSQIPILSLLFAQNVNTNNNSELWFALRPTWEEIQPRKARQARLENTL